MPYYTHILRFLLFFGFVSFSPLLLSQNATWQSYTYGKNVASLALKGDFVWVGTESGLVRINRFNNETSFFDQTNVGFPLHFVRTVSISPDENIWAGMGYNQLLRYNGRDWTQTYWYRVRSTAVDKNADVWLGTSDIGLLKLTRQPGTSQYAVSGFDEHNSSLPDGYVQALAVDDNNTLWIGVTRYSYTISGALVSFDGSEWKVFTSQNSGLPSENIYALAIGKDEDLWVGTYDGGVARYKNGKWAVFNTANSPLPSNDVNALAVDSAGTLWVGTWYSGLLSYDGATWTHYTSSNSGLSSNLIQAILADPNGTVWVGTTRGLVKFDGAVWTEINTSKSVLPGPYTRDIAIDRQNAVWISSHSDWEGNGGGLVKIQDGIWTVFDRTNAPFQVTTVNSMAVDWQNNLWAATSYGGLLKYDGAQWTEYRQFNSGIASDYLINLHVDLSDNVWIASLDKGISKFTGSEWVTINAENSQLPSNKVHAIIIDGNGNGFFGTDRGLVRYKRDGTVTVFNSVNSPIPSDTIRVLKRGYQNDVWIGTPGGLARFDSQDWKIYTVTNSELPSNDIRGIDVEQNYTIWVSMFTSYSFPYGQGGLAKWDGSRWEVFHYYDSWLPNDEVYDVAVDMNGNKWIGTWNGLAVYHQEGISTEPPEFDREQVQNFPNPFNVATRISFTLAQPTPIEIFIYNMLGQRVKTLVQDFSQAGRYSMLWDGIDDAGQSVPSGMYVYLLKTNYSRISQKMILLK